MDREELVVAAEARGEVVADQVQELQPVDRPEAGLAAEIVLDVGLGLRVLQVLLRGAGHDEAAGDVLHLLDHRVVVLGEVLLGDVGDGRARHREAGPERALVGGGDRERAHRLAVGDQPGELLADVAGAGDAVRVGRQQRAADHEIEQRQLVADRGEPVVLDEAEGEGAGVGRLPAEEHPVPRDEHVVEDRQRVGDLVARGDRVVDRRVAAAREWARDEFEPPGVDGHRERERVVAVGLPHGPGRQDDQLVGEDGVGRVRLRPAHHDPVRLPVDHAHVVVGVLLLARPAAPVALDVRLGDPHGQVVLGDVPVVRAEAVVVRRPELLLHGAGDDVAGGEEVRADLADEHDQRPPGARGLRDHLAAAQEVLGRARELVEAVQLPALLHVADEVTVPGVVGDRVVDRAVAGALAELGMGGDVGHALAPVVDPAVVPERLEVLRGRPERHQAVPPE